MTFGILEFVLLLLVAAVVVVVIFRVLKLPALLGYLLLGIAVGLVPDNEGMHYLAGFGIVFLMFTIGLEFSLPKLLTMRRVVFGLGAAQVMGTVLLCIGLAMLLGYGWRTGVVLGATWRCPPLRSSRKC